MPFMNQIAVLPRLSRHRMSLLPSPLKSPVPTMFQVGGTLPTRPPDEMVAPFISHTATLPLLSRQRMSPMPSPLKSPTPTTDQVVGMLPTAAGRADRRAVHEPHRGVAAGVVPQQVGLAVAVEVALADDRPGGGHAADAARRRHRRPVHQPERDIAAASRQTMSLMPSPLKSWVAAARGLTKTHAAPARVVARPAHDGGVAVGGQRDRGALSGATAVAGADQLRPCWVQTPPLRVNTHAAPVLAVVVGPAHDRGVAVGGQRDREALCGDLRPRRCRPASSLLGPDAAAAGEHPRRASFPLSPDPPTIAVLPSADSATERALRGVSDRAGADQLRPCWVQTPPLRVNTHAAPAVELSAWPPTMRGVAVGRTARRRALPGVPTARVPTSFDPCWVQTPPLRVKTHAAPVVVSCLPSRPRWRCCRRRTARPDSLAAAAPDSAGADQLGSLLGPDPAAAGEHPRRAGLPVVVRPAHDRGVAVGGQRDGVALLRRFRQRRCRPASSLLAPDTAAAGEDPRRSVDVVVVGPPTIAVLPSADSATEAL